MSKQKVSVCWFRRDLRLDDNAALYHALKSDYPVLPIFIFDKNILAKLEDKKDKRVVFIHEQIERLQKELSKHHSSMLCYYEHPIDAFKKLLGEFDVKAQKGLVRAFEHLINMYRDRKYKSVAPFEE